MIAKCIVILAIVAQINGSICNSRSAHLSGSHGLRTHNIILTQGSSSCSGVASGSLSGSSALSGAATLSGTAALSGSGRSSSAPQVLTRNVVVKGKYPVALTNCGPTPDKQIPVTTSHIKTPVEVKPTVRLPFQIPPQRTVSHTCTCYKTVLRPRVHEQIITVPSVQKFIETSHKPVVENIHYEAHPTNCNDNSNSGFVFTRAGSSSLQGQIVGQQLGQLQLAGQQLGQLQLAGQQLSLNGMQSGLGCSGNMQAIQIPQTQTVQAIQIPQAQTIQAIQAPQVQAIEIPQAQCAQTVQLPLSSASGQCF